MMEHHKNVLQPNQSILCPSSSNNEIVNIGINYENFFNSHSFKISEIKYAVKLLKKISRPWQHHFWNDYMR